MVVRTAVLLILVMAALLLAVDVVGNLNITGTLTAAIVDFRSSQSTAPVQAGTSLPSSCTVGQMYFLSSASPGQNIHLCTASNTWTQVSGSSSGGGGSGSSGTFDWKPNSRYVVFRSDMPAYYNQGSPTSVGDFYLSRLVGSTNLNVPSPSIDFLHPGIASITTTSTSGNRTAWAAQLGGPVSSTADSLLANTDKPWEMEIVFRLPSAGDLSNVLFYTGMMAYTNESPPRGVAVRYLAGTDTNFRFFYANQNSWGASVDTGVAADNNWHRFRIRSDGTVTNRIWLRLDNGTEVSGCPSGCNLEVPTYLAQSWSHVFYVNLTTNEAAVKTVYIDYVHLWVDLGASR